MTRMRHAEPVATADWGACRNPGKSDVCVFLLQGPTPSLSMSTRQGLTRCALQGRSKPSGGPRSRVMAAIKKKNTRPELTVRSVAHRLGFRFRLHDASLPGTPDIVFRSRKKMIFVHGCWWHRHDCHLGRKTPKSNLEYWNPKLERNVARDRATLSQVTALGWSALVIWECETANRKLLADRVLAFLREEH
jgi:DNA mismatch endonuclease, patch repair protein